MATQQQVSGLFKSLGARIADAHNAAATVPVNTGGDVGLPEGINNGVAQLTVMEFIEGKKEDDRGKFYFRAAGVVKLPEYHDGIKCRGKQTSVLIPFFDTPKRQNKKSFVEHHWQDYRDLFAKLGVEQPPAQQPGETKDAATARILNYYQGATQILLDKTKPVYFEFRTWKPEKQNKNDREPMVFELWGQRCEHKETGAAANPAVAVGPAPSSNGQHSPPPTMAPAVQQPTALAPEPFTEPPQAAAPEPPTVADAPTADLDALAEAADADPSGETDDGKAAIQALSAVCQQLNLVDQASTAADWTAVVALIRGAQGGGGSPAVGGAVEPVKGATVTYNGQRCEVTSVNNEARTVTLKGPDKKAVVGPDKKLLKVSFDSLA